MSNLPETILQLRRKLGEWELAAAPPTTTGFSLGCAELDQWLPQRGIGPGTIVEWLVEGSGTGAGLLALRAAGEACRERKACVVLDRRREINPLVAAAAGRWELPHMIVVQAADEQDERWAIDQALRSPSVGAVWLRCARLDSVEFRRWQLAAETGGAVGMLVRPARVRNEPSWADVRLLIEPRPASPATRRWHVRLLRCRGSGAGQGIDLIMDERTGKICTANEERPKSKFRFS